MARQLAGDPEIKIELLSASVRTEINLCAPHMQNDRVFLFARLLKGLRAHCPGMIVQFSTVGRSGAGRERGGLLSVRPAMASLTAGSNTFPTSVYENLPDRLDWLASQMQAHHVKPAIEAFDLPHIHQAAAMAADGRLSAAL